MIDVPQDEMRAIRDFYVKTDKVAVLRREWLEVLMISDEMPNHAAYKLQREMGSRRDCLQEQWLCAFLWRVHSKG